LIGHGADLFLLRFVVLPPPGARQADDHKQHQPGDAHQPAVAFFARFTQRKALHRCDFCRADRRLFLKNRQQLFFWNVYQASIGADITAHKGGCQIGRRPVLFDIAYRGDLQAQAFGNRLLAESKLLTSIAQTNARGLCFVLVLSGFSIHSLQLLVREK